MIRSKGGSLVSGPYALDVDTEKRASPQELLRMVQEHHGPVLWVRNGSCSSAWRIRHMALFGLLCMAGLLCIVWWQKSASQLILCGLILAMAMLIVPPQVTDLDHVSRMLHQLPAPRVLLTTDGDRAVPSSYHQKTVNRILQSPNVLAWFTQNYDGSQAGIVPYPIGLDVHTNKWWRSHNTPEARMRYYADMLHAPRSPKRLQIFCDSHLHLTNPSRQDMHRALQKLPPDKVHFHHNRTACEEYLAKMQEYAFVVSPPGNGMDCHRTWEAFLLGCVVIVQSSPLDVMFEKHQLPVIVLREWSDLDASRLQEWWDQLAPWTARTHIEQRLQPEYWLQQSATLRAPGPDGKEQP